MSNFHPCEFEHNGIIFHSSEQLIQYMKAIYIDDNMSARSILDSNSPLECKRLARNINNYNNKEWVKAARGMCEVGIYEKFNQNSHLKQLLLSTGEQTIVEASKDHNWGSGMSLYDERCLVKSTWYLQGLLGKILEDIRGKLAEADTEGYNASEDSVMETTETDTISTINTGTT